MRFPRSAECRRARVVSLCARARARVFYLFSRVYSLVVRYGRDRRAVSAAYAHNIMIGVYVYAYNNRKKKTDTGGKKNVYIIIKRRGRKKKDPPLVIRIRLLRHSTPPQPRTSRHRPVRGGSGLNQKVPPRLAPQVPPRAGHEYRSEISFSRR